MGWVGAGGVGWVGGVRGVSGWMLRLLALRAAACRHRHSTELSCSVCGARTSMGCDARARRRFATSGPKTALLVLVLLIALKRAAVRVRVLLLLLLLPNLLLLLLLCCVRAAEALNDAMGP